jgi:hypothetical protein
LERKLVQRPLASSPEDKKPEQTPSPKEKDAFLAFVSEQVNKMREKVKLISDASISFYEVNMALAGYMDTLYGLTSLYQGLKTEHQLLERYFRYLVG